ncbi:MAG: hypoxanthine phosphoribosyltransferase [Flavobacteriales bacterium]|nr:hypoxanthine phosphoribosyltransferase [Flavobacteriales bacterium]
MSKTIELHDKSFEPYISESEIEDIVSRLVIEINANYKNETPVLLGILNGSFMFISDLMKKLDIDVELSFLKLSSYEGTESSGKVNELIGLNSDISGRPVIVVEDIVDTGKTLQKILEMLPPFQPKQVEVCSLLLKPEVFQDQFPLHYIGKEIPNRFVVGYGLDYDELGRNLPEIYQLKG